MSKIMSKMTHVNNKNTNNCFQIRTADSFKCKTDHKKPYYISLVFSETPGKTPDCVYNIYTEGNKFSNF